MRRRLVFVGAVALAAVTSVAGAMTAAASEVDGPRHLNLPPRVALTIESEGVIGCPVSFAAVATDPDDELMGGQPTTVDDLVMSEAGIDRVEFHVNGQLVATDNTAPYGVTLRHGPFLPRSAGENVAFARAFDRDVPQLSADSEPILFLMVEPPPSLPDIDPCMQGTAPPTDPVFPLP